MITLGESEQGHYFCISLQFQWLILNPFFTAKLLGWRKRKNMPPWHSQSVEELEGPMHERKLGGYSSHSSKGAREVISKSTTSSNIGTHIDFVLLVADEEVMHHACLVEIPKADHVFHPLGSGRVHWANRVHVPSCDPVLLKKERQHFNGLCCYLEANKGDCHVRPEWFRVCIKCSLL